ncbi:phenol hydroxylase subunit [Isoalcanivorax beigongshangi]|uniref:Phenol hydroxylase subunit n=1 Tax=Isoalcanivorax beigongshangi TaxID=3238810 RepID=A0ABV4AEF4_9GAMM
MTVHQPAQARHPGSSDGAVVPLPLTKYVRVRSAPDARFVEFDFSINDPTLFVELVLPPEAFKSFCATHEVRHMTTEQAAAVDADMEKWRYGDDTLMARQR